MHVMIHASRRLVRRLGFDLLPLTLFVMPIVLPVLWLLMQAAALATMP